MNRLILLAAILLTIMMLIAGGTCLYSNGYQDGIAAPTSIRSIENFKYTNDLAQQYENGYNDCVDHVRTGYLNCDSLTDNTIDYEQ